MFNFSEETTSFSRTRFLAIIALTVILVTTAAFAWVSLNRTEQAVTGQVLQLSAIPIHTRTQLNQPPGSDFESGTGAPVAINVSASPHSTIAQPLSIKYDQFVVLAEVRIRNQSEAPMQVDDLWGTAFAGNQMIRSVAVKNADFPRFFTIYPQFIPLRVPPILRGSTIAPGETVEGMIILNYPFNTEQWNNRNSLELHVSFMHQPDLVLHLE